MEPENRKMQQVFMPMLGKQELNIICAASNRNRVKVKAAMCEGLVYVVSAYGKMWRKRDGRGKWDGEHFKGLTTGQAIREVVTP